MPCLAIQQRCTWHVTSPLYPCAWVVWVSGQPRGWQNQPIGHRGQMHFPCLQSASLMCLRTSCTTWLAKKARVVWLNWPGQRQTWIVRVSSEDPVGRGTRPPPRGESEPGEWHHGWQYYASSTSEHHHRETIVLAQLTATNPAHLRSHSGPGARQVLHGSPTGPEFQLSPELFRTLVLERLRLPLHITEARCECGGHHDTLGRHRSACPRSGRLRVRALSIEKILARVCHEAKAIVRTNVKLRDMNVEGISVLDARAIEVLACGLPLQNGAQLAVDITLRSAITSTGGACPNAPNFDGAVLHRTRLDKETTYQELLRGERCHLVVVGLETGGRWSNEAVKFVDSLASARAREAPPLLYRSAFLAWRKRWTRMLAVSCGRAYASSLVTPRVDEFSGAEGIVPAFADL